MPKLRDTIIHNIIHLESWKLIMDRLLPFGRANTQKRVKQFQKNFIAFHFLVTSIVDNDIRIRILENICFLNCFYRNWFSEDWIMKLYSYDIYLGKIFDEISIWINVARFDNFPRENFSFQSFISHLIYLHINNKYLKYHKTIQNVFQSTLVVTLINVVYGAIFIYIIS